MASPLRTILAAPNAITTVMDTPMDNPYGGFLLQYGDNDEELKWGGMTPASPDLPDPNKPHPKQPEHAKKKYVLELVQDLILLGYLSTSRSHYNPIAKGTKGLTGNFSIDVVPAVLALKYDLVDRMNGYSVDYMPRLASVNSKPTTDTPGPIYWTTDWHFPRHAIFDVQRVMVDKKGSLQSQITVQSVLNTMKRDTSPRNLEYIGADGEKKSEPFDDAESEYIRILQLLEELPKAEKTPKFDPKQASKKLSDRKAALDKEFRTLGEQLKKSTEALERFVTNFHRCRDNFAKLKAILADPSKDNLEWQVQQLDELYRKRNELPQERTGKPFDYFNSLRDGLKEQVENQLKKQVDKTLDDISSLVKKVQPVIDEGKASGAELAILAPTVTKFSKTLKEFRDGVSDLANDISGYDFKPAAERYAKMVRQYSMIDRATACCIKSMIHLRKINNRRAFVLPHGDQSILMTFEGQELGAGKEPPQATIDNFFRDRVAAAQGQIDANKTSIEIPPRIVQYAYKNESNFKQFHDQGELKRVAVCGTDFRTPSDTEYVDPNKGLAALTHPSRTMAFFDEVSTDPNSGYIVSRGWGFSQVTPPNTPWEAQAAYYVLKPDGTMDDTHSKATTPVPTQRDNPRGLPMILRDEDFIPAYIASLESNVFAGIKALSVKFLGSKAKRNCTYTPKHDCDTCLSRFERKDFSYSNSLLYIISNSGFQTIQDDIATAAASADSLPLEAKSDASDKKDVKKWSEAERAEWPCSWLTARLLYGGKSEESFQFVTQSVGYARLNTGKDLPPKKKAPPPKKGTK